MILEGLPDAFHQLRVSAVLLHREQPVYPLSVEEIDELLPGVEGVGVEDNLAGAQADAPEHPGEGLDFLVLLLRRRVVYDCAGVAVIERTPPVAALPVAAGLAAPERGPQLLPVASDRPLEPAFRGGVPRKLRISLAEVREPLAEKVLEGIGRNHLEDDPDLLVRDVAAWQRHLEQALEHGVLVVPESGDLPAVAASAAGGRQGDHQDGFGAVDDPIGIARVEWGEGLCKVSCQLKQAGCFRAHGGEQLPALPRLPCHEEVLLDLQLVLHPRPLQRGAVEIVDVGIAGLFRRTAAAERVPGHLLQA